MALVIGRDVRLVEGVVVKRRDGHGRTPEFVARWMYGALASD
jgi:hypothetical protein